MAQYGESDLLKELNQDMKSVKAELAQICTDIALIKCSLEERKNESKWARNAVIVLFGIVGGGIGGNLDVLLKLLGG